MPDRYAQLRDRDVNTWDISREKRERERDIRISGNPKRKNPHIWAYYLCALIACILLHSPQNITIRKSTTRSTRCPNVNVRSDQWWTRGWSRVRTGSNWGFNRVFFGSFKVFRDWPRLADATPTRSLSAKKVRNCRHQMAPINRGFLYSLHIFSLYTYYFTLWLTRT